LGSGSAKRRGQPRASTTKRTYEKDPRPAALKSKGGKKEQGLKV